MQPRTIFRAFLACAVCLAVLAASCAPEKACSSDATCSKGQICKEGTCAQGCRQNEDCKDGESCIQEQCQDSRVCEPGKVEPCYEADASLKGKGLCKEGYKVCLKSGARWSACVTQTTPQPELCDQADNDCNGKVDDGITCQCKPGTFRECYNGPAKTRGLGECRGGFQYCEADNTWGRCFLQVRPTPEQCDQKDNNCDGRVDEYIKCECTPGASRDCYNGPKGTQGKGPCRGGTQRCGIDSLWGPCEGEVLPTPEEKDSCNGKDDDCDGLIDNRSGGSAVLVRPCFAGATGCTQQADGSFQCQGSCVAGTQTCNQDPKAPAWGPCQKVQGPQREECNGKDDDCDGNIDNGLQGPQPCYPNQTKGCPTCLPKETPSQCQERTRLGGVRYFCEGDCAAGTRSCEGGTWSPCKDPKTPKAEECNGKDDNCDGQIDEGCSCQEGQKRPCYSGPAPTRNVGICRVGEELCEAGKWGPCTGEVKPQAAEICDDSLDNDCNGTIDDGCPTNCKDGQTRPCYPGPASTQNQPPCQSGTQTCKSKAWGPCAGATTPQVEVCDGVDNDCNGKADDITGLSQNCAAPGQKGECARGKAVCEIDAGGKYAIVCKASPAKAEFCNGLDDDCNGKIDDISDLGKACQDPKNNGPCIAGTWSCVSDASGNRKACVPTYQKRAEECNGKDDDCDGVVDNAVGQTTPISRPCYSGAASTRNRGICSDGREYCNSGAWDQTCSGDVKPATEICNNKDDDCDGFVDEVSSAGSCTVAGLDGLCAQGVQACQAGKIICKQSNTPQPETCNGKDDDCDGKTDNGFPGEDHLCEIDNRQTMGRQSCQAGKITCTTTPSAKYPTIPNEIRLAPDEAFVGCVPSDAVCAAHEKPVHKVTITRPIAVGRFEVTRKEFLQHSGYTPSFPANCTGNNCPATNISWHEAARYANQLSDFYKLPDKCFTCTTPTDLSKTQCSLNPKWAGKYTECPGFRLPTESEWEFIYRLFARGRLGNNQHSFYTGTNCSQGSSLCNTRSVAMDKHGWYDYNSQNKPQSVGLKLPYFGLYDLAGNVWEWVYDYFGGYDSTHKFDPTGPLTGTLKVIRGGAANSTARDLRGSHRGTLNPGSRNPYTGFRLVRTLTAPIACTRVFDCPPFYTKGCVNKICTP